MERSFPDKIVMGLYPEDIAETIAKGELGENHGDRPAQDGVGLVEKKSDILLGRG
jgi:hypothetical protein